MSCYHPKTLLWFFDESTGEVFSRYSGKEYYKDDYGKRLALDPKILYTMPVPCGKCLGCKLDYSRVWADRMTLEYDHTKKAVFVTLTYNDEHLKDVNGDLLGDVDGACLCKRDLQLFLKRVRKKFSGVEVRFYASAEYGPATCRPHYHMILFGVDLQDFGDEAKGKRIYLQGFNDLRQPFYRSDILDDLWSDENGQIGFAGISEVSYETFAYVARYTLKKVYKDELSPEEKGLISEWALMSRRPGLAAYYLAEHPDRFITEDGHLKKMQLPFQTKNPIKSFPKYLVDRLEIDDPEIYYKIKEQRQRVAQDRWFQEIENTDKSEYLYLLDKEREATDRTKSLLRHKIL